MYKLNLVYGDGKSVTNTFNSYQELCDAYWEAMSNPKVKMLDVPGREEK